MTTGDRAVETAADRLDRLAERTAVKGSLGAKLADELAGDAAFLRKLKPSLIARRARGELPRDAEPGAAPRAPSGPQLGRRPARDSPFPAGRRSGGRGPSPLLVAAAALAAGVLLAKTIDWRSHAHPRR